MRRLPKKQDATTQVPRTSGTTSKTTTPRYTLRDRLCHTVAKVGFTTIRRSTCHMRPFLQECGTRTDMDNGKRTIDGGTIHEAHHIRTRNRNGDHIRSRCPIPIRRKLLAKLLSIHRYVFVHVIGTTPEHQRNGRTSDSSNRRIATHGHQLRAKQLVTIVPTDTT